MRRWRAALRMTNAPATSISSDAISPKRSSVLGFVSRLLEMMVFMMKPPTDSEATAAARMRWPVGSKNSTPM